MKYSHRTIRNAVGVILILMPLFITAVAGAQSPHGLLAQAQATAAPETVYVVHAEPEPEPCVRTCFERKGFLLGINAGWGGASFGYRTNRTSVTEDPFHGGFGGLRFGYAVSNSIAFTLEGFGVGVYDDKYEDSGIGAGFVAVTWWPEAGGFFLRMGFGGGGGELVRRSDGEKIKMTDRSAALFGLGYEFRLTEKFALGLAVDAFGLDLDLGSDHEEDWAGGGGASIQFNWYL